MSLLEHPTAQDLLADATVTPATVRGCRDRLVHFLQRYLPRFYRKEQRELATVVIQGHLSALERKTCEPIARQAGRHRKPVQQFVGNGGWDDEAVQDELRQHVAAELADPEGILILDSSGFAKKGSHSCGVQRQWCGRLGKLDNCQVGVFLSYATARGYALVDRRLYVPKEWAQDRKRRKQTHVPKHLRFKEKWRLGLDLLQRSGPALPHRWVVGDDEFGRASQLRRRLRQRRESYLLDVPCNTKVRDLEARRPARRRGQRGGPRKRQFVRVATWAAQQPASAWQRFEVRAGEKGPLLVEALLRRVQAHDGPRVGPEERLLVVRSVGGPAKTDYALSSAAASVPLAALVRVHAERHRMEELLETGKGEVGLAHYEVRSWIGWHHHMTLCLVALWFLILEKLRLGEKNPGHHGGAGACHLQPVVAEAAATAAADRGGSERGTAA